MSDDTTPAPTLEDEPPHKKRRTRAITIASAAAAIVVIAGVGLAISINKSDDKGVPSTSSSAPDPTPSVSKDIAQEIADWRDNGGSDTLSTLVSDLTAVGKASDPVDLDGLRDSCSTLTADIESAQEGNPIPDAATNKRWSLALEHLGNSASACTRGAVSGDQDSFDLMASEMEIGTKHLKAVNKSLGEALGQ